MTPQRIQLRRTKGWRIRQAVSVARPHRWGNPFTVAGARAAGYQGTDEQLREVCVDGFRRWLAGDIFWQFVNGDQQRRTILQNINELRGRDLACWCPLDQPCHADVLLALANASARPGLPDHEHEAPGSVWIETLQ